MDLADFLAGETNSSPRLILALIRGLPEDARWSRRLRRELADSEVRQLREQLVDEETEAALDAEFWTPDRQLMAALINAVYLNTQATGQWEKGKVPDFPTMGPKAWQPKEEPEPAPAQEPVDLMEFHLTRLGMPAGGGRTRL